MSGLAAALQSGGIDEHDGVVAWPAEQVHLRLGAVPADEAAFEILVDALPQPVVARVGLAVVAVLASPQEAVPAEADGGADLLDALQRYRQTGLGKGKGLREFVRPPLVLRSVLRLDRGGRRQGL